MTIIILIDTTYIHTCILCILTIWTLCLFHTLPRNQINISIPNLAKSKHYQLVPKTTSIMLGSFWLQHCLTQNKVSFLKVRIYFRVVFIMIRIIQLVLTILYFAISEKINQPTTMSICWYYYLSFWLQYLAKTR